MNFNDLENRNAYDIILENDGVDALFDTLIAEIKSLRERILILENN